jgi:dihydrofolate synthase/folylpolyglutamate synthase
MATTSTDSPATFFEITTALALRYFAREKVDWVVWETGLGGRLDATNIVTPEACVITGIALDHQQYLGNFVAEIAAEKAGIIKPGVPVISAAIDPDAQAVIARRALEAGSELIFIPRDIEAQDLGLREGRQFARLGGDEFELGLIGAHQVRNAACAVAALSQVEKLSRAQLDEGLRQASWPGRFEVISRQPPIVLDGAHNVEGVTALISAWRTWLNSIGSKGADHGTRLVFASVDDKPTREIAQILAPLVREVWLVRLSSERSRDPAELAGFFPGTSSEIYPSTAAMWRALMTLQDEMPTLMAGSLFLAGEVLAQRQGNPEDSELNELLGNGLIR